MRRKNIRLLIMGDEQVGKSSLVYSIISQVSNNIEKTLKKVILPPEMCIYSKQIFTQLIDTSENTDFETEIHQSDLILLVYDVSDPMTIEHIQTQWMRLISDISKKIPVILVGNKIDKKQLQFQEGENQYMRVKDILKKITRKFKQVQMGIECSAFYERNVQSVLNCAQRAVLYPLYPLYNLQSKQLTKDFKKALIRIFRILDTDLDGRLYDSQLNQLQQRVFQSQLNIQDIKAIKEIILKELQEEQNDSIDINGFLTFMKKCIQMLKIQICWSILRYFDFDDELKLIIKQQSFIEKDERQQSLYLSHEVEDFLIKLHAFANKSILQNKPQQKNMMVEDSQIPKTNHKLSQYKQTTIIQKIFESSPKIPLPQFEIDLNMCEQKFISVWSMFAFINSPQCYESLLYLGYQSSIHQAFNRKKVKKTLKDFEKLKQYPVYSILIIDCPQYNTFFDSIFSKGHKVENMNQISYEREARLMTGNQKSKMLLLFRIKKRHIEQFFVNDSSFMKRIDLIINFEENQDISDEEVFHVIPETILYRRASKREVEKEFKVFQLSQLDLGSFPVEYKPQSYQGFYKYILSSIQSVQLGLPKATFEKLKLQKKRNNEMIISAVSVSSLLLVAGAFAVKRFWQ